MEEIKPKLLKTKIFVRAYCGNFDVTVKRASFLNIEDALEHIHKAVISTAMVIGVTHYTEQGEVYIENEDYKDPSEINVRKGIQ